MIEQDFTQNYEIILIDDASTDNSLQICQQFVARWPDKFLLIESVTNAGVSEARNRGLEKARGQYLMFVDPDDVLPADALTIMVAAAEQYRADIVKGNLVLFDERSQRPAPDMVKSTIRVTGDEILVTLFDHSKVRGHIGGKLFRRDRFGELRFTTGVRMAQDLLYFSQMFAAAESLVLLDSEVYRYRKHSTGSTGRKYERGSYIDWLGAVENSGKFATSNRQKRSHKGLMVRTMTQIARESRNISAANAAPVLEVINQKCADWKIGLFQLILRDRLGLRTIFRYLKLQLALKQIRHNLAQSNFE